MQLSSELLGADIPDVYAGLCGLSRLITENRIEIAKAD